MGLDVYMYELGEGVSREEFEAARKAHEEAEESFWEKWDENWSEEEKERRMAEHKETCPPDPEGEYLGYNQQAGSSEYDHSRALAKSIEIAHPDFPDQYNKIGYWRSSYNSGGINSVLARMGLPDLYYIAFGEDADQDGYVLFLDWAKVKERAEEVLKLYDKAKERVGGVDVMEVRARSLRPDLGEPHNENEALEMFLTEREKYDPDAQGGPFDMSAYSNAAGEWFHKGIEVLAFIPGKSKFGIVGNESVYVVYRPKSGDEEGDWYRDTLEIVRDTAQHALDNGPERFYVHWSA